MLSLTTETLLLLAVMENSSLSSDAWYNVTTTSSDDDPLNLYVADISYLALKVSYIIIGTVGIIDNLFVLVIFALFIKITDKVTTVNMLHGVILL